MSKEKLKFLEFIQNIITRMNTNSFQIKAMCIAIISAIFAIYATTQNPHIILIAFIPLVICCFLDMYYLWQERRFRSLYNDIANIDESQVGALCLHQANKQISFKQLATNVDFH